MKRLLLLVTILIVLLISFSYFVDRFSINIRPKLETGQETGKVQLLTEESVVIDAVKNVGPSVVTIVEDRPAITQQGFDLGPFSIFGQIPGQEIDPQPRNIGSGFVVEDSGLIVTNKHVVSDTSSKYQILTSTDKTYDVENIYRDPLNDIAILKISASGLKPVTLGDSSNLQVGQFVIAIGTALGEFRNTVTTGVISGLGRGITAGSPFQGFVEQLDNVIQTDAAINPGNSGGPLLNSSSQVIGINTAVASGGENIGFAIPAGVIKESIEIFNKGGQFDRAFLGVSYIMLDPEIAAINNLVAGAYIQSVIPGSPAENSGLRQADIIIEMNGKRIEKDKYELSRAISENSAGDRVSLRVWRNGQTIEINAILGNSSDQ